MEHLQQNLLTLEVVQPQLAAKFRHYKPSKVTSAGKGECDILVDGEPFYGMDAKLACEAQLQQYLQYPSHFALHYPSVEDCFGRHQQAINRLNKKAQALGYPLKKPHTSTMLVLGSGIGYVLEQLINKQHCRTLILVEPEDDMLYQFLSHVDINSLSEHCQSHGGIFTIIQPTDLNHFTGQINDIANQLGYSLFAEMGVYRHYETALFNDIFDNIKANRHRWLSTWGFFDDEIIGLNHTLQNAAHQPLLFNGKASRQQDKPVLIVGNGPSLDKDIELLKRHGNAFLIMSCGTALPTLLKNGIRPDIHAEMERTADVYELHKPWLSDEVLENTILIALNTVVPSLVKAFKTAIIFAKANDVGTMVLQAANADGAKPLYYCNPTVTNLATSACVAMGFTRLVLLGCDFGYKDPNQHHAASSEYFNPNSFLSQYDFDAELEVTANFGGKVGSERLFNLSRQGVESLLQNNPKVDCINCSDGAFIKGSKPMRFEQLLAEFKFNGKAELNLADNATINLKPEKLASCLNESQRFAVWLEKQLDSTFNEQKLLSLLAQVSNKLNQQKGRSPLFLFYSGVIRYLSVTIAGHLGRTPITEHTNYIEFAVQELRKFCTHCHETLTTQITQPSKHK